MDINARRQFIRGGVRESGFVFAGLLLLGGLWWIGFQIHGLPPAIHSVGGLIVAFSVSLLSGPVPSLLVLLDITNRQLYIAWALLTIPYWVCLGAVTGFMRWHTTHDQQQVLLTGQCLRQIRWLVGVNAFLLALLSFTSGPVAGPNYVSNGRNSPRSSILNNLRQIDGAKQQLAIERKLSPEYVPTEADLVSYLTGQGKVFPRVGEERYVLNAINEPPHAVLDVEWRIRRRGWTQGFTIAKGTVFRLQ